MPFKPEDWITMPIAELQSAQKTGPLMVYQDRWWLVDAKGDAVFFKDFDHPQCNLNKAIMDYALMRDDAHSPAVDIAFVPWAYVRFKISDYC